MTKKPHVSRALKRFYCVIKYTNNFNWTRRFKKGRFLSEEEVDGYWKTE